MVAPAEGVEPVAAVEPPARSGGDGTAPAGIPPVFRRLLVNTLMTGVTSSFLWFALTFWVYLETRSVVATGVIGGAFSISSAVLGPVFGTFVDRHRKENAASPLTAFLMAPLAEAVFMPFMTDGAGADWIGGWYGTGPERGIALLFTVAGLVGVVVTVLAWISRSYRRLATTA